MNTTPVVAAATQCGGFEVKLNPGETTVVSWKKLLEDAGASDENPGLPSKYAVYESDGDDENLDRYCMIDLKNGGLYPYDPEKAMQGSEKAVAESSPLSDRDLEKPRKRRKLDLKRKSEKKKVRKLKRKSEEDDLRI